MSVSNQSAKQAFVDANTTGTTGADTVSLVFNDVTTATTATTSEATALYTGTSKKKFALPAEGFIEVLVGDTLVKVPYYKA